MAHFAQIDENNIVTNVVVVDNSQEHRGHEFLSKDLELGGRWERTSYNTRAGQHDLGGQPFRKNYARIGDIYDEARDAFISPRPFPSWNLNEETCIWESPKPFPTDDSKLWKWDESVLDYVETTIDQLWS